MSQRVALFPTCVVDTVAPQVGEAVVRVLRRLGHEVVVPKNATCCAQPAWNAGFAQQAATVARTTLDALEAEDAQTICVPAGSCATMMRVFWPELFELVGDHDAKRRAERLRDRVREFSEFVAEQADDIAGTHAVTVAYHHSCHMLRELRITTAPKDLLARLDGCDAPDFPGDDRCCGFGGLFAIKQPELSVAMADDKIAAISSVGADEIVGCDQSCLMHLEGRLRSRGQTTPVRHLAEVLDEAMTP